MTVQSMTLGATGSDARPYLIEIVPVDRGWILEKIAGAIAREAMASSGRYQVSITSRPTGRADLIYFLPESAWRDDVMAPVRVTYLAHKEDHPEAAALFEAVARKSDCCVTSSSLYAGILRKDGAREVVTIPLGVDTDVFVPKIRVGVVGRTYHTGRKGESLLARSMDLPFVEFVFTGEGWPLPANYYSERDMVPLLQSLDYLLIPSLIEGGPVPMLEALSTGCRVIAPTDVGMVGDFPHIPFRRGDADDLRRVLEAQVGERLALRAAAIPCDWRDFAKRHLELFSRLIERSRARNSEVNGRVRPPGVGERARCRVLLMTHGTEGASRGGPTTRVRNIVAHLRERGLPAESGDGPRSITAGGYDVIHVFNSWPPQSALATLAAARRSGSAVVFSPIALDLANWPLFHPFMEKLLLSVPGENALLSALAAIREVTPCRSYSRNGDDVPIEGIPGLFESLRLCCDLADRLVFLSEYERDLLTAIGARVDHGVIIRNGVDVDRMTFGNPELFRRHAGLDRYLLCVGRMEYRKNQALAALAARDLGVKLVLVGAAGDAGYANHIRRLGGRGVRILGRIEDRQLLASAYAGADAFVFPSWCEGAPLAAMEAGAAGAPLVLGGMSSEREYFGDDAAYVHPADIEGIRRTVRDLIERSEHPAERQARSRRLAGAFSMQRHADETWALYERVHADRLPAQAPRAMVMDVSSLIHFLRTRQPFTGVPMVEWNLFAELSRRTPAMGFIAYNDVKGRFVRIAIGDLKKFDEASFNARYWFPADGASAVDRRAMLHFADRRAPLLPGEPPRAEGPSRGGRTATVALGKRLLQRLPRIARDPAIALLRGLRPGFDPFRMPQGYGAPDTSRPRAAIDTTSPRSPAGNGLRPEAVPCFTHPLGTLTISDAPRRESVAPVGARLLTLGQSWLSNEPLLDEMLRLAETRALYLEPYVYDMTYHTGAQLTGWADNAERTHRLVKLLGHSCRVYTESRQVEVELQKLRSSRELSFSTCRTQLRGRDLPNPARRGGPAYRPDSYVLVISSFNRRKNHDFLVRVWRDLHETWIAPNERPFRLVLAGQIQEEHKYGDPAFVADLARSNIDVHANVSDGALADLMGDCAFTAYPSMQEGWGLPAQESLMCGKICLVSDSLPVAQEIVNAALIRLSPTDFYAWHEALRTWLDNTAMRRAFSQVAATYVAPSWSDIADPIHRG